MLEELSDHTRHIGIINALGNDGIIYIADLLEHTEESLLRTPGFGQKGLSVVKDILKELSDNNKTRYELSNRPNDLHPEKFQGDKAKIERHFGLNLVPYVCAREFQVVSDNTDDGGQHIEMRLPQIFGDLIRGQLIYLNDTARFHNHTKDNDEQTILDETHANKVEPYHHDPIINLTYYANQDGLLRLKEAGLSPTQAMANAANRLIHVGKQRAAKRYGLTF